MKKMIIVASHYWKCMLKSSDACPKFYSPSLRENTTDSDGGVVVTFVDSDTNDERKAPRKIYIPAQDYETLPKYAYVNFDDDAVADGAPRYLTVKQFESKVAKPSSKSAPVSTTV